MAVLAAARRAAAAHQGGGSVKHFSNQEYNDHMTYLATLSDKDIFPHKEFSSVLEWVLRPTVKIILQNNEGKIALVTNPIHNIFLLPGGGIDEGEDVFVAADRECREEVGYVIIPTEIIGVTEEYRAREGKRCETYGVLASVKEKISEDLRTEEEKKNGLIVAWFSKEEVEKKFHEQEELLRAGNIEFYNTGFNIIRDSLFFKEASRRGLV